jgi:FtsP/CotA-like multicopper oxidase with cupredoxin domain
MACDPHFIFQIDGHSMNVIEADGITTKPYTVDSIDIYAGQRYSFILTANQTVSNYCELPLFLCNYKRTALTSLSQGFALIRNPAAPDGRSMALTAAATLLSSGMSALQPSILPPRRPSPRFP